MKKSDTLLKLKEKCLNCRACELSSGRTNIVFSDGVPDTAKAILIGEAPGANEDATGTPFVGRAGKLLNQFLEQADISRENDLYLINTVKCRPPQNRVPTPAEKSACEKYLFEQIDIINPKVLIFCGSTALKSFFKQNIPISKIRGQWLTVNVNKKEYKAMAIFHPSYLLRNHSIEEGKPRAVMLHDLKNIYNEITA